MSELIKKISVNGQEYGIHAESVQDGVVTNSKIADNAINAPKIMDRAITSRKIDSDTVESYHLRYGAVTTPKIDNGSVTKEKLDKELRDAISGYHDDGSGNLVPVKHPDLSTQPNILPYKVGGSYVYEQLICLSEAHCSDDPDYADKVYCEIPWKAEVENPRILSASFFTSNSQHSPQGNIPVMVHAYNTKIEARIDRIALIIAGSHPLEDGTMPTGWLRIVYSEFEDTGSNYYYSYQGEEKLGELHIVYDTESYDTSLALVEFTGFDANDIPTYGDIISRCDVEVPKGVRLYGDYLQRFLAGDVAFALFADYSAIYGICKGSTCVDVTIGQPFAYWLNDVRGFGNLYGLDISYALLHGETVVLRINSTES